MVFDTHVHISLKSQKILHHEMKIETYMETLEGVGGGSAILCLNPFDESFICKSAFVDKKVHKSSVEDYKLNIYKVRCLRCDRVHYIGEDVFRERNVELLELSSRYNLYSLAFLVGTNHNIQNQVDYYELEYPDFQGYKIHPTIMMFPIDKLLFKSKKTILVHSGKDVFSSPSQIVNFAEKYDGNVIVAHCARFDKNVLKRISTMNNVWIDTSPYTFLFSLLISKSEQMYCRYMDENIKDFFYNIIDIIGIDKILFASDSPWGNLYDEVNFIKGLCLDVEYESKVLYENALKAFNINDKK